MEHILILGGSGNIGFPLIQILAKQPNLALTVGVHDLTRGQQKFSKFENIKVCPFDFLDQQTFPNAFANIEKVFFVRPPQLATPKEDMWPFLKYARKQKVKQIVFISLIGVEKNPVTPHHKIEKRIKQLEIPYTFIRPSFFMQNLNTTHREDIQKNHDLFIPAGHSKTSFIDTRDIAEVAAVSLLDDQYLNTELEITGSTALTYEEISKIMTKILCVPVTYSRPSLLNFRRTMIKREFPREYANVMTMLYFITKMGNAKKVTDTTERVLKHPARSFADYVEDYKDYFL